MCGIGGLARLDGGVLGPESDAVLAGLAAILSHRGPDDRRLLRDGPVGLAFTRLSLVDPLGGAQPLVSEDGNLVLIANGEVYNHRQLAARLGVRTRTGSDCEILLHLYAKHGLDFLDQVNGMFAIVLWDRLSGRLVLARDRFGIKPLYFHRDRRRVVFGSEIKSLFADPATPRRLDWPAVLTNTMLSLAPFFGDETQSAWFEQVQTVPAATVIRIDLNDGTAENHRYWSFPGPAVELPSRDEDLIDRYRELLAASVADCATADTEIGLFLSGGVDSATVAALAAPHAPALHTFTVLNAGTAANGDATHARRVAELLGLPHHRVVLTDRVPSVAEWRRLVWLTETPMCNPEVFYKHELHRYAKQTRPELRGMLLGAAADEFGGGYTVPLAMDGGFADCINNLRHMARQGALQRAPLLGRWSAASLINDDAVRSFTAVDLTDPYAHYLRQEYAKVQQYNCWHEDRTAAGSGIEARVPFLDHRLVELLASIPPSRREALLWDKRLIRGAAKGLLPDGFAGRPKVAFFHGQGERQVYRTFVQMLQQDGAALVEQALAAPGAADLLDAAGMRAALAKAAHDPATELVEMLLRAVNIGLLAAAAADLPAPLVNTPAGPLPRAATGPDQDPSLVRLRPAVDPDAVLDIRPGVLLLHGRDGWYLAVDGTLEFRPDGDWLDVLQAINGTSTAGHIAAGMTDRVSVIEQLVDMRLVEAA
jgi:asparagine synthase (glutamine-hydrolysing)